MGLGPQLDDRGVVNELVQVERNPATHDQRVGCRFALNAAVIERFSQRGEGRPAAGGGPESLKGAHLLGRDVHRPVCRDMPDVDLPAGRPSNVGLVQDPEAPSEAAADLSHCGQLRAVFDICKVGSGALHFDRLDRAVHHLPQMVADPLPGLPQHHHPQAESLRLVIDDVRIDLALQDQRRLDGTLIGVIESCLDAGEHADRVAVGGAEQSPKCPTGVGRVEVGKALSLIRHIGIRRYETRSSRRVKTDVRQERAGDVHYRARRWDGVKCTPGNRRRLCGRTQDRRRASSVEQPDRALSGAPAVSSSSAKLSSPASFALSPTWILLQLFLHQIYNPVGLVQAFLQNFFSPRRGVGVGAGGQMSAGGMSPGERRQLFSRHLVGTVRPEDEEAIFLSLPPEKQKVVIDRLASLDEYLQMPNPSRSRADEVAAKLGIARRTLYHLLGKLREHGPVRGLAPGYRIKRRPSVATEGLGELAESVLIDELSENPEVRLGQIVAAINRACAAAGVSTPPEADIRRRLHELRRRSASAGEGIEDRAFGRSILIDQSAIDLAIFHFDRREQAVVTLIIDRQTRIIFGVGIASGDGILLGLEGALFDAIHRRLPALARQALPVAPRLEEVEWVVPPGREGSGEEWTRAVVEAHPGLKLTATDHRPKRHGNALLRLMGDKLGIFTFKVRASANAELVTNPSTLSHQPEDALKVVNFAADAWNRPIIERLAKVGQSDPQAAEETMRSLAQALKDIFQAVVPSVSTWPAKLD